MKADKETFIKLLNEKVKFTTVLPKLNSENIYTVGRPCFCPFHDNTNTPAAVIYNNDGKETLWCFSEQKLYKPEDIIKLLINEDPYKVGEHLWNKLTETEQEVFLKENQPIDLAKEFSVETTETDQTKNLLKEVYKAYQYGKISYQELLRIYLKLKTE